MKPQILKQHSKQDNPLSTCSWSWDWAAPRPWSLPCFPPSLHHRVPQADMGPDKALIHHLLSGRPHRNIPLMCRHLPNPLDQGSMRKEHPHGFTRFCLLVPSESTHSREGRTAQKERGTPWSPSTYTEQSTAPSNTGGFTLAGVSVWKTSGVLM